MFEASDDFFMKYTNLINSLNSLAEVGEPQIATMKGVKVVKNPFWGIEGGFEVDLTIIFIQKVPKKFADLLPEDVAPPPSGQEKLNEYGLFSNEEFKYSPYVESAPAEPVEIPLGDETITIPIPPLLTQTLSSRSLQMSRLIINWMIDRAWDPLVGADGEVKFEGFGSIFEEEDSKEPPKKVKVVKPKK